MDFGKTLGFQADRDAAPSGDGQLAQYINLKLAALGCPAADDGAEARLLEIARPLLSIHAAKTELLGNLLCPADQRIQDFLDAYLKDVSGGTPRLPHSTFMLDRHGLARLMSLPAKGDTFSSEIVSSHRVRQGVLHNPDKDRRTTQGVFHIAEGGFPIPDDKAAVPKAIFRRLLAAAVSPPKSLLRLPFTAGQKQEAKTWVSLLLRPVVCPEVRGFIEEKSLEVRFFAPGGLVCNLDFVESIFGNAGNPFLPENDAALDAEHWTGHTGCVILAPHLIGLKKKDVGLPAWDKASERQRRDGMCWKADDELYNGGQAFKVVCRDGRGVIVTLIADNYFGYCKKEVKSQISYSANLYGLCEEEHSGGATVFPSYDLGEEAHPGPAAAGGSLKENAGLYPDVMELKPEGYAVDKLHPDILYVPEDARFDLSTHSVHWTAGGQPRSVKLLASHAYVYPSGYKVRLKKQTGGSRWHLYGTVAEGTLCHKPCTVSGGGKSEISKPIVDAMIPGPVFVADFRADFDQAADILRRDFGDRFKVPKPGRSRPILSEARSLGSVIKLLTPAAEYTDAYNEWLKNLPPHVRELIFVVKRFYKPEWGDRWREHFSVDVINGHPGHELKCDDRKLVANYLRVGLEQDGSWRIYRVRQDYTAADKIQAEDDITVSVVAPRDRLGKVPAAWTNPSLKVVKNCEYRLFQRPDDAIHRGYDKQTEADLARPGNFLSNFEPLTRPQAQDILDDAAGFDQYTEPMKRLLRDFLAESKPEYVVSSAHPRLVEGKPSKNPRYLQDRPDLVNPRLTYLSQAGARLARRVPSGEPVYFPVNAVLAGRRNNPPDAKAGLRPLAVFNPIHYQELPELFMDFICSVTGKSPSTTGFGSEGALTKGPFNALWPVVDLNNALVSYLLTGYGGFTSAAGYVGPRVRVDHDISLLVPEIWSRMSPEEREPARLIANGHLEKLEDFEHRGRRVLAGRLGWRITAEFVRTVLGRIFNSPTAVFSEEMLKPELQDKDVFADGVDNIVATQKRVAEHYFADGSVEAACPPLKALLHVMARGSWEGKDANAPAFRALFTREALLAGGWYRERLRARQTRETALWTRHVKSLEDFLAKNKQWEAAAKLDISGRLARARGTLSRVSSPDYLASLQGTLGADPLAGQLAPFSAATAQEPVQA
ncbi:MAG: hypothetical protein ACT4O3_06885 [Elusimicrobiota bacterium]